MANDSWDLASVDPTVDPRANYDYQGGREHRSNLVTALEARVDGDVRFDAYTRELFATDASAYEELPIGVVSPVSTDDVAAVMAYCAEEGIPVLPRGGGTSLAGQAVNEAVVLDFKRHMDGIVSVDSERAVARAQPGITLARLNDRLKSHGLKYAPDPAWGDKSVLGGCIGNNTTGAHSLKYEKADGYVEAVEVVLADGSVTTFGWVDVDELDELAENDGLEGRIYAEVACILEEDKEEIPERYPDLTRNVSGYNLDRLVDDATEHGQINVGRLLAGSEGTLAIIVEAEVSLVQRPETTSVVLLTYEDVLDAMEDVAPILEHDPSAVEVMDDVLLDLARDTPEFADLVSTLPEGTDSTLLVEFYADSDAEGRRKVANLVTDRLPEYEPTADADPDALDTGAPINAINVLEAHDEERQDEFWKMRKAGLPILLSRTGDDKHWPFIEDTAIPAENLPEYVADIQAVFEAHDTFASYYAHAGPGVLHIRPLLNLKNEADIETMEAIADEVTDLVIEYEGSVSGEHGDGKARTQWNKKLYGDDLWETFRDLKTAFDPDWLLNPGMVSGDTDLTNDLRFNPDYEFDAGFDPVLNWENENGFQGVVELCHGCAGCTGFQDTTGGVMCPTYRAAKEEITSTRGRANMLRQAMSGDLPADPTDEEFVHEVLDLCVGCKGCKVDCPSGVDMGKLKAELVNEYHQQEGASLRDNIFANVDTILSLSSTFAPLSNWALSVPGAGWMMEKTVGIARERTFPTFYRNTFRDRVQSHDSTQAADEPERKALLLADPYTNYNYPDVGTAALEVLEAAGVLVDVPEEVGDSGRPAFSKSMIDEARSTAAENVEALLPYVRQGWDIVTVEPSDAVMYQLDYLDLLSGTEVQLVAENTYGIFEYLDVHNLDENPDFDAVDESLAYHGHCQQKATKKDHYAFEVLQTAGYEVDELDSGCCGMAGSFGYEAEHYSMSVAISEDLFDLIDKSSAENLVAPGASCRAQLERYGYDDEEPPHPVKKLAAAL